jgi:hypothetical protein
MPGDLLRHGPQLTMEQFHALQDERPREEKWELIDAVPGVGVIGRLGDLYEATPLDPFVPKAG